MISFTLRPFYPLGESSRYPFDRRLGGPQSRSGSGDDDKKSYFAPAGNGTLIFHSVS